MFCGGFWLRADISMREGRFQLFGFALVLAISTRERKVLPRTDGFHI